jgi:acetylornithine deacetylase/succinyl-diaminopimelate desuccinylase-like protein
MAKTALVPYSMKEVCTTLLTVVSRNHAHVLEPFGASYGGNVMFASPYVAEKGYLDILIQISTPGGHSSLPPSHTVTGFI